MVCQKVLHSLSVWGSLDKAEAVGHLPSPVDIIWQDPCWAHPTKPTLKKGWARAVWNNNLMLTVALTESQAQAQLGHGWAPTNEVTHKQGGWMWWRGVWGWQGELINRAQPGSGFKGGGSCCVDQADLGG